MPAKNTTEVQEAFDATNSTSDADVSLSNRDDEDESDFEDSNDFYHNFVNGKIPTRKPSPWSGKRPVKMHAIMRPAGVSKCPEGILFRDWLQYRSVTWSCMECVRIDQVKRQYMDNARRLVQQMAQQKAQRKAQRKLKQEKHQAIKTSSTNLGSQVTTSSSEGHIGFASEKPLNKAPVETAPADVATSSANMSESL